MSLLRVYNSFYFASLAIFISFLPVYLGERGISASHIGLLLGVGSLMGIISQPVWGIISDRLKTVKKILVGLLVVSTVAGALLFQSVTFPAMLLLNVVMSSFMFSIDPLTENMNYRLSQRNGKSFGSVRTFGSFGYAMASLVVGWVASLYGMGSYSLLFLGCGVISLIVALMLPDVPASENKLQVAQFGLFLKRPETIRFFGLVLLVSIPHRMNDSFLGIYMQGLGGTTGEVGMAWFLASVSEVIFFAM
ncbi:MAG: MFS transporter, partial [Tumebacillaceae bacterium]